MNRSFIFVFVLLTMGLMGASKPPQVMFRVHVQTQGVGLPKSQAYAIRIPDPDEVIYVKTIPELTERDIAMVTPHFTDQGSGMRVKFNHHGTAVLNAVTAQNQGAVLVFFLNGRLIYAPSIDLRIANGEVVIPRGVKPEEIKLLEEAIKYYKK